MQSATLLTLLLRSIPLKYRRTHCVLCNEYIRTADARRIVRGLENSASASLLVYSDYALQECSPLKVTAAYALNHLELRVLKLMLYNAIKEYHDDRTRKTIYFHGYTVEDNYNAIREKWKRLNDYHDNDKTIIAQGNEKTTSLLWMSAEPEETRVRLRELSGEIHDILLREFRGADDFIESVIHNDDEQFAMLAEEYIIDNCIVYALALMKDEWELELEDCDALVERYEEEINCSDLYSTV
ncbi:hypothetical protein HBI15_039560 [Parastagonospora nodorum]|nr:hypothetical protein HBI15_039560 [Parastagonospora nodorum]